MKLVGGSTYELQIHALTNDHMVELPNKNYKHIVVPEHWVKFFLAQTAADKVTFMESVWLKSKPNEQNLIIQDLQYFFGPSDPPAE